MPRVSKEALDKLQAFFDALPEEARSKCALCNETLTHIVKTAEVETGAGTATVTRELANRINDDIRKGIYSLPESKGGGENHIYAAKTSTYPTYVKIGKTTQSVHARIKSLSGIMLDDFELIYSIEFSQKYNLSEIEKIIFEHLAHYRVRPNKEWFDEACMGDFLQIIEKIKSITGESK